MPNGFGHDLYKNLQKIRVDRNGIHTPIKANGKDGIVFGDPKLTATPAAPKKAPATAPKGRSLVARLKKVLSRI